MNNETSEEIHTLPRQFSSFTRTTHTVSDYYIAAIISFGFVGNFSCVIACRLCSTLNRCRFGPYLIACSISDTVFLLCLGLIWLKGVGIHWHDLNAVCMTTTFLTNTTSLLSGWHVAAITFEVASSLRSPHRVYGMITRRHALLKRVFFILIAGLLANSWTLAMARSVQVQASNEAAEDVSPGQSGQLRNATTTVDDESVVRFDCQIKADRELIFRAFTIYDILLGVAAPLTVTLASFMAMGAHAFLIWFFSPASGRRKSATLSLISYQESTFTKNCKSFCQYQFDQKFKSNFDNTNDLQPIFRGDLRPTEPQNRLEHFAAEVDDCVDRERTMLIITTAAAAAVGTKRLNMANKEKQRQLMSPAKFHAMLHHEHFRECLRLEDRVRPLLILKAVLYVSLTSPHFVYRLWFLLGSSEGDQNEHSVQLVIYFLFFTQFAMNAVLYAAYGCVYRFFISVHK